MKKTLLVFLVLSAVYSSIFLAAQTVEQDDYTLVKERFESYAGSTAGQPFWLWLFPVHLPDIFSGEMSTGNAGTLRLKAALAEDMLLSEILGQEWYDGWVNYEDEFYTYDQNNFLVEITRLTWESGEWVNDSWQTITNNETGQAQDVLLYLWNADSLRWDLMARMHLTYNPEGDIQQMLMEFWMDPIWVGFMKMDYYYNTYGVSEILTQGFDYLLGTWVNSSRDLFTYNSSGWVVEELSQTWIEEAWQDDEKETMIYNDQGQHVESLVQQWLENTWVNYLHFTYAYNDGGDLVQEVEQYWVSDAWMNNYKYQYTYFTQSYLSEILELRWIGNEWQNSFKETYYYNPVGIADGIFQKEGVSFISYPNPFRDILYMQYRISKPAVVSLTLYDLAGKKIEVIAPGSFKPDGLYQETWTPDPGLEPGVYLLELNSGGSTGVCRVIKK